MPRHRYGFAAAFALAGLILTIPDPSAARPAGFRAPAFTTVPNRIFLPSFRPRFHAGSRTHGPVGRFRAPPSPTGYAVTRPAMPFATAPSSYTGMGVRPVTRFAGHTQAFRVKHHRRINGWLYPLTVGPYESFFGTAYDPSDEIPVYAPLVESAPDTPADAAIPAPPRVPVLTVQRTCQTQVVKVATADGNGEREVNVVRC
jgi:hypothetical protein